jgi:predicted Ser/Thr protein kinase
MSETAPSIPVPPEVSQALVAFLSDALASLEGWDAAARLAGLRADQRRRWVRGQRVPAEAYRLACPWLKDNRETFLDLVYCEWLLRQELGERPTSLEYRQRFPQHAETIQKQFAVGRALETPPPEGSPAGSTIDAPPPAPQRQGAEVKADPFVTTAPPGPLPEPPGITVPGFEVLGKLGEGGMGVVYKAQQVGLNRLVALKMIRPRRGLGARVLSRFRAEAEAVAWLKHPHIVPVYAFGEHDGQPYFALEYVVGGSLADRLEGRAWPTRPAVELVATLAGAIQHAHERGIIHRDLKPANVLLDEEGRPHITDFGLAHRVQEGEGLTLDGDVLGTPGYMAPEQAVGLAKEVGPAADIFGLGAILYNLLTGLPPHQGPDVRTTLREAAAGRVVPLRQVNPRVSRRLERICMKALAADPTQRHSSAAALEQDLRRYLARPRLLAVAGVTAALVVLILLAALGWPWSSPTPATVPHDDSVAALPSTVLSGNLTVRVWTPGVRLKRGLKVEDPGALPVRTGEQVHVEAHLTEPAFVYILWVDGKGEVDALYPWSREQDWKGPPPSVEPKQVVHSPPEIEKGWPIEGPSGLETVLLLARRTPLPAEVKLAEVLGKIPPAPLGPDLREVVVRGFDRDRPSEPMDLHRRPAKEAREIDDALLHLLGKLQPHFEMIRAVQFAHQGP